jgi:hypothetical protein
MSTLVLPCERAKGDVIELVCSSGHRTPHSLARVRRLDDGWCGTCGADIKYQPVPEPEPPARTKRALASV